MWVLLLALSIVTSEARVPGLSTYLPPLPTNSISCEVPAQHISYFSGILRPGYNKPGYNKPGYNKTGYNKPGYNKLGYNRSRFNMPGYDKPGYNKTGIIPEYQTVSEPVLSVYKRKFTPRSVASDIEVIRDQQIISNPRSLHNPKLKYQKKLKNKKQLFTKYQAKLLSHHIDKPRPKYIPKTTHEDTETKEHRPAILSRTKHQMKLKRRKIFVPEATSTWEKKPFSATSGESELPRKDSTAREATELGPRREAASRKESGVGASNRESGFGASKRESRVGIRAEVRNLSKFSSICYL